MPPCTNTPPSAPTPAPNPALDAALAALTEEERERLGHLAAQATIAWLRELQAQGPERTVKPKEENSADVMGTSAPERSA